MFDMQRCILIADDEPRMIRALRDFFRAKDFYVLEASNGQEALDIFYEHNTQVDMVILDVMMPVKDGFSTLKELRSSSHVPVIMLTAKGEEYDELNGFNNGADDYVTKPFSPSLLLARVEAVLKRFGKDLCNEIVAGDITVNCTDRCVYISGKNIDLTRREFDLLYYLILNKSITFSREQLLNNVWGYNFEGGNRTVDTHIRQLRSKLNQCANYIETIHCIGYRFEVQHENVNKE